MSPTTSPRPSGPIRHPADEVEVPDSRFSALVYNPFLWLGERRGMAERRRRLLSRARGRVLEIGAGTGLNLPHYPDKVEELVVAEPAASMAARIDPAQAPAGVPLTVIEARAERLPFQDGIFDTVVSTMVLCTVQDQGQALAEIGRALRPGGRLLFCEHVRADTAVRRRLQERLAGPWAAFADGCRCDLPTLEAISRRFEVEAVERESWRGMPGLVKPLVIGAALSPERA